MKRIQKIAALFLSFLLMTQLMLVPAVGEQTLDADQSVEIPPTIQAPTMEEEELEPYAVGEEIEAWREEGVRHYYLGDGVYEAVVGVGITESPNITNGSTASTYSSVTQKATTAMYDTYISSSHKTTMYGEESTVWVGIAEIGLFYQKMPTLPDSAKIREANLHFFYYYYVQTDSLTVAAYPMEAAWDEYESTWESMSAYNNRGVGTEQMGSVELSAENGQSSTTPKPASVDVTSAVLSWYSGKRYNEGVALKRIGGINNSVIIKAYESEEDAHIAYYSIKYELQDVFLFPGKYYIRNGEFGKYAQIDDNASTSDAEAKIELWDMDGASDQRWRIQSLYNGYYQIFSVTNYNKVLTAPSGANGNIKLCDNTWAYTQQWKVTLDKSGLHKLSPRSNENYYMAAGIGILTSDGRNVRMRANQSDHKDEWFLYWLDFNTAKLNVVYDQAYSSRYSNATERISQQILILQEKFLTNFGIWITCSSPKVFSSYADIYCSASPTQPCTHASNADCTDYGTYHHKNIYNIFSNIAVPDTSSTLKVAFVGHDTCCEDKNNLTSHPSNPINGLANETLGLAMITNFSSSDSEAKTLIHEFGHLYGVIDHYGSTDGSILSTEQMNISQNTTKFSKTCIYGENREQDSVLDDFAICEGCSEIILRNMGKYNHQ